MPKFNTKHMGIVPNIEGLTEQMPGSAGFYIWEDFTGSYKVPAGKVGRVSQSVIVNRTTDYTIPLNAGTVVVDASANDVTLTLPPVLSAYDATDGTGLIVNIKRVAYDTSDFVVTVITGDSLIDNQTTQVIPHSSCMTVQCDGVNWHVI